MIMWNRLKTLCLHSFLVFNIINTLLTISLWLFRVAPIWTAIPLSWYYSVSFIFTFYLLLACFRVAQVDESNKLPFFLNHNLLIAHRGGSLDAPENTLAAIKHAADNGADGVEVDIEFTRDGIAVLLHDSDVDRTTDGSGLIGEMDYSHTRHLDAAYGHPLRPKFGQQSIPSLEEAVESALQWGHVIFLDCKSDAAKTALTLGDLFEKYPALYSRAIVCSFWPNIIYKVRRRDPNIVTGLTFRPDLLTTKNVDGPPRNKEWWKQCLAPIGDFLLEWCHYSWLWYICGNSIFLSHKDMTSRESVKFWQSLGIKVAVWTVNEKSEKEFFSSFGCICISDKVIDS